jgi:hypothetical protein
MVLTPAIRDAAQKILTKYGEDKARQLLELALSIQITLGRKEFWFGLFVVCFRCTFFTYF